MSKTRIGSMMLCWLWKFVEYHIIILSWQQIRVHMVKFQISALSSGVLQCAILSPIIFSIGQQCTLSISLYKILVFLDDIKLFINNQPSLDCVQLQTGRDRLVSWSEGLSLQLNVSKCQVITFTYILQITLNWST